MKKALWFLLLSSLAYGQGHYIGVAQNSLGQGVANPTVRVCTEPALGSPCTPLASAIYTCVAMDSTCPSANPLAGDQYGNFDFYAAPGVAYHLQISGQTLQQYDLSYVYIPSLSAGGGTPAAPPFSLQFNNSGVFGGIIGTNGQVPVGQTGAAPIFQTVTGDSTLNAAGVIVNTGLNGTNLAGLGTGVLFSTAGVPSIATAAQIANPFGCPGTKAYLYSGTSGTGCDNSVGTGNVSNSVNFPSGTPYYAVWSDGGGAHTVSPYPNGSSLLGGALSLIPSSGGLNLNVVQFNYAWLSMNGSGTGGQISLYYANNANPGHGTTLYQLAKIIFGAADNIQTTDTAIASYVVVSDAGMGGHSQLAVLSGESVECAFDSGGGVAYHYAIASTAAAGKCMDSGVSAATSSPPSGVWVVGYLGPTGAAANSNALITTLYTFGGGGGGGSFSSLLGGTSTSQGFVVGNGSSMTFSGTGIINANQINGASVPTTTVAGINGSGQLFSQTGTIANNTTGNAGTATAAQTLPSVCTGYSHGVNASWNALCDPPSTDSDIIFNIQARPSVVSGATTPVACGVDGSGFYCINASLQNLVNVQSFYKTTTNYTFVGAGDAGTAVVTITVDTPIAAQWYDVGVQLSEINTPSGCSGGATASVQLDYTNADNSVHVTADNNMALWTEGSGSSGSVNSTATVLTSAPGAAQIWDGVTRRVHVASSTALKMILFVPTDTLSGCSPFPQVAFTPVVFKVQ